MCAIFARQRQVTLAWWAGKPSKEFRETLNLKPIGSFADDFWEKVPPCILTFRPYTPHIRLKVLRVTP